MSQLQPIQLEDGTTIYIEVNEEMNAPVRQTTHGVTIRRGRDSQQPAQQVIENFASLQNTIKAFAVYTLNSFKEISNANVNKVTLEFGVNI